MARRRRGRSALALLLVTTACAASAAEDTPSSSFTPRPVGEITLVAAGNICAENGECLNTADRVAALDPDLVMVLGDLAYEYGTVDEFRATYGGGTRPPTRWGRPSIKSITLPAYGNHDCSDGGGKQGCNGAVEYFGPDSAFGQNLGDPPGTYTTVEGQWFIVVLNSAGDEGSGSATRDEIASQDAALASVLDADDHTCQLVAWHHPRFSSGIEGSGRTFVAPWFETAYEHGVDVILNAHHHQYERFAPQDPEQQPATNGVREFVVGTGGAPLEDFGEPWPNSEVRLAEYGVLEMQLRDDGTYSWQFLDDLTDSVFDQGSDVCH